MSGLFLGCAFTICAIFKLVVAFEASDSDRPKEAMSSLVFTAEMMDVFLCKEQDETGNCSICKKMLLTDDDLNKPGAYEFIVKCPSSGLHGTHLKCFRLWIDQGIQCCPCCGTGIHRALSRFKKETSCRIIRRLLSGWELDGHRNNIDFLLIIKTGEEIRSVLEECEATKDSLKINGLVAKLLRAGVGNDWPIIRILQEMNEENINGLTQKELFKFMCEHPLVGIPDPSLSDLFQQGFLDKLSADEKKAIGFALLRSPLAMASSEQTIVGTSLGTFLATAAIPEKGIREMIKEAMRINRFVLAGEIIRYSSICGYFLPIEFIQKILVKSVKQHTISPSELILMLDNSAYTLSATAATKRELVDCIIEEAMYDDDIKLSLERIILISPSNKKDDEINGPLLVEYAKRAPLDENILYLLGFYREVREYRLSEGNIARLHAMALEKKHFMKWYSLVPENTSYTKELDFGLLVALQSANASARCVELIFLMRKRRYFDFCTFMRLCELVLLRNEMGLLPSVFACVGSKLHHFFAVRENAVVLFHKLLLFRRYAEIQLLSKYFYHLNEYKTQILPQISKHALAISSSSISSLLSVLENELVEENASAYFSGLPDVLKRCLSLPHSVLAVGQFVRRQLSHQLFHSNTSPDLLKRLHDVIKDSPNFRSYYRIFLESFHAPEFKAYLMELSESGTSQDAVSSN